MIMRKITPIEDLRLNRKDEKTGKLRCDRCGMLKEPRQFHKSASQSDGYTRNCRSCCYGQGREKWQKRLASTVTHQPDRRQVARAHEQPKPALDLSLPAAAPTIIPNNAPTFIDTGIYLININNIALIDRSCYPQALEIKLNIQEVGKNGYPECLCYSFEGDQGRAIMSAINIAVGRNAEETAREDLLKRCIQELTEERDLAVAEREAALQLAEDNEVRLNSIRSMLSGLAPASSDLTK